MYSLSYFFWYTYIIRTSSMHISSYKGKYLYSLLNKIFHLLLIQIKYIIFQRKSFLEKKGVLIKDGSNDEDNNDDDNFMVLDSVGSADGIYIYIYINFFIFF